MSVQTESRREAPRLHCAGELFASLSALWRARSCTRGRTVAHAGLEQGRSRAGSGGGEAERRAAHRQRERQWGAVKGVGGGRERRAAGASRAVAPR